MFLMEQCYFLFVFLQAFHELPWLFFSRLSQQNEEDKWVQWISLDFCRITMPSEILDPHPIKVVFKTQIGFTYNTVLLKESPTDQLLQMALDPTSHPPTFRSQQLQKFTQFGRFFVDCTGIPQKAASKWNSTSIDTSCVTSIALFGLPLSQRLAIGVKMWSQPHHGGG